MMKISAMIAAITLATSAAFAGSGGDPFERVWVDSLKVQASGTSGRTAHQIYTISAGPDRAFIPDTLQFIENSRSGGGRIEAKFLEDRFTYVTVPNTIAGVTYNLDWPQTVVISVYAETGSGPDNYNRGGWLNGWVDAETVEVTR